MKRLFVIVFSAATLLVSCKKDNSVVTPQTVLPTLTTTVVSSPSTTGANSGGNISSEGSAPVTARGVVWDAAANPTINLTTKTSNGTGSGSFASVITGLLPNTTYHVRAYATNSVGTAYGNDVTFTTGAPKLYVCGSEWNSITNSQQAKVWIDGVGTYWSNSTGGFESMGNKLLVTDAGDVYVSGAMKNTQWMACYWKNGVATMLTDGTYEAGAGGGIFISGTDVYACGGERNAANVFSAKYWKNGTAVSLTDGTKESVANSIFVSGTDVYCAGYEKDASGTIVAKYWKNGIATTLGTGGVANSIVVAGTDVYIAGNYGNVGCYWKNSTLINLNNCINGTKVFLSGTDVYVSGSDNSYQAAYWKNGSIVSLSDGESANSVFVNNTDVYIAGRTSVNIPCYWKNGQQITLSSSTNYRNYANDIIYK